MKTLDERVPDLVSGWIVSFTWSTWGNHHIRFHCRPAKKNSCLSNCCKQHFQLKIHCAFSFLLSVMFYFSIVSKRKITVWKIKQNVFFWNWSLLCLSLKGMMGSETKGDVFNYHQTHDSRCGWNNSLALSWFQFWKKNRNSICYIWFLNISPL